MFRRTIHPASANPTNRSAEAVIVSKRAWCSTGGEPPGREVVRRGDDVLPTSLRRRPEDAPSRRDRGGCRGGREPGTASTPNCRLRHGKRATSMCHRPSSSDYRVRAKTRAFFRRLRRTSARTRFRVQASPTGCRRGGCDARAVPQFAVAPCDQSVSEEDRRALGRVESVVPSLRIPRAKPRRRRIRGVRGRSEAREAPVHLGRPITPTPGSSIRVSAEGVGTGPP
jgi:hypothetical protein